MRTGSALARIHPCLIGPRQLGSRRVLEELMIPPSWKNGSHGIALLGIWAILSLAGAGHAANKVPVGAPEGPLPPVNGVWQFDFGGEASPGERGFIRILPTSEYSPGKFYGYTKGKSRPRPFDQNRRVTRDNLSLDDVTRDGVYGGNTFRIDLPDGRYEIAVLTGQYSRPGANRPDSHFRTYSIRAGDTVLYERDDSPETFFHAEGRYFHNYHRDWHPDVDLYTENISRWIPFAHGVVAVTGGALTVAASHYAPINALWIFPEGSADGHAAVDAFKARQRLTFNSQYPYLPETPEHMIPKLPTDVRASGVVLYVKDSFKGLQPGARPIARDLGRPLRLFASRGEREAGVVGVLPLRDIAGPIELRAAELVGADGASIPASALDIRYVRYGEYPVTGGYVVKPHFLVPWRPDRMEKHIARWFWVDLHTPDDAKPGFYDTVLTFSASGVEAKLPVQVRVLPLNLPMSRLYAGVYAGNLDGTVFRHFRTMKKRPHDLMHKVMRTRMEFYADQGFTGLYDSLPWHPFAYRDGEVKVDEETWDLYLDVFETAKSIPNFRDRVFCYYLGGPQLFPKCPNYLSIRKADQMKLDDIRFSDAAVGEMTAMVQEFYGRIRARDLPEVTFYVFDELGNHGAKGARWGREMLKALNRCKEATPGGFRTCVSALRCSVAREYLPHADIVMPNSAYPVTPETIEELQANGCTLGLYNMGASRFSYGFYPWRVNAYTRAQWSFSYDGDSRDPYVSLPTGARYSCDSRYTPDWDVLPSIGMLRQREGVDDYRYVQLLEDRLQTAKAAGRETAPEAQHAKAVLAELRDAVDITYLAPRNNLDKSTMDYYRWRVAEAAIRLGN